MPKNIITGFQDANHHEYGLSGGVISFATNGRRVNVSAANRSSASAIRNEQKELSVVTYNHLGIIRS